MENVQQKVPETFGELGHMVHEERLRTLGLSILEKGRLRRTVGQCGTSPMRGYKEKEPGS